MRKFTYIFFVVLFISGCGGMQSRILDGINHKKSDKETVLKKAKEPNFCESGKILPGDCTEADKDSRKKWVGYNYFYRTPSDGDCFLIGIADGRPARVTVLRNGSIIVNHAINTEYSYEFLGFEVKPEDSLIGLLGINGSKFERKLSFEFNQDIESIVLKYANVNKTVRRCKIEYTNPYNKNAGLLSYIEEKRDYELAQKPGNVVPSILQQSNRETVPPEITFSSIDPTITFKTDSYQIFIRGKVTDDKGVFTLMVDGQKAAIEVDGTFAAKLKLRIGKNKIPVLAEDINGNIAKKTITIIREDFIPKETLADVDVPPNTKTKNPNGIAVVIGIEDYQHVSDATYAYNDAEVFREYLADTMGFSKAKVKIVTNRQATLGEFNKLLGPDGWLARNIDPGKSEIVVYYSGHGIPDSNTKQTGLLPFDIDPNYSIGFHLSQLYKSLGGLNAKSVTVFLDACFTGENRERKMLLADARGIVVVQNEKSIPNNLTVLSAASGGQFSGALKEKEHGLFTYYVLKGLGGEADSDKDKKLTMGELAEFVRGKVKERAAVEGREQIPELQGNPNKILVEW